MHIVIMPNRKFSFGFYGFDKRDGFALRIPFLACSVFYTSADKLFSDTFRQIKMGRNFVAVGSKDWRDELDRHTEELRERNSLNDKQLMKEIMELRKKLGDTQAENRTLRNAIKIVGNSENQ